MKLKLKNKDFYKFTMSDTQARDIVSTDIDNGFEGDFNKLSKTKTNDEMYALYDSVISQFLSEAGLSENVTKNMSWVNSLAKYFDIPSHNFKLNYEGQTFLLKHFVRVTDDNPKLHAVVEDEKLTVDQIAENDILIFSKDTVYGFDQNLSDTNLVVLTIVFSVEE